MGAYDYVSMPGAPAAPSYAAPMPDFSWLANLPQRYQEGQQYGVKRGIQTAFQGGFPTDQNGNPDYGAMANKLLAVGGPEAAQPYFQMMLQRQAVDRLQQAGAPDETMLNGGGGQPQGAPPSSSVPSSHPAASGPANITGQTPAGPPGTNPAPNTLRGMLTAGLGEGDAARLLNPAMNPMWAKFLGAQVGPDDPLTDQQAQALRQRFPQIARQAAQSRGQDQQSQPAGGPPFAVGTPSARNPNASQGGLRDENLVQPNTSTSSTEERVNGDETAQLSGRQRGPDQNINQQKAALLDRAAKQAELAAADPALPPSVAQTMRERAQQLSKAAEQYRGVGLQEGPQAGYNNPLQYENVKARGAAAIKSSDATYNGIHGQALQFGQQLAPAIQLGKGILSDPRMYAGFGANGVLTLEKLKTALGGDPRTAALMEGLGKLTALSTLSQLNDQRAQLEEQGQQSGRIFSAQVDLVQKASASQENTLAGNRFLLHYQERMGEFTNWLDQAARNYRTTHDGLLGSGFDQMVADHLKQNKIFTDEERANPSLLSAPDAPPTIKTPQQAAQWKTAMGLNHGDAYRTPDGRYKYVQ